MSASRAVVESVALTIFVMWIANAFLTGIEGMIVNR